MEEEKSTFYEKYLKIEEPEFPKNNSYKEIVTYLIDKQKSNINYYRLVTMIGFIGLLISVYYLLLLISEKEWDWNILFNIKQYPAILFSFVTIAFGQIEFEIQKKELYKKLSDIAKRKSVNDDKLIIEDYKKWTWEEFQSKFKKDEL